MVSISATNFSPVKQALLAYGVILLAGIFIKMGQWAGILPGSFLVFWIISTGFLLLFTMANSIICLSAPSFPKYWSQSVFSYMGLAFVTAYTAFLFTNTAISDAASIRWIYIVLTLSYLVFLSIVGLIKLIVELAQRKDTRNFDNRHYWKKK